MKPADLRRTVDAFEIFRPKRLLFTRFDETSSFGPVFQRSRPHPQGALVLRRRATHPEDLEPASKSRLLDLILPAHAVSAQTAAALRNL